MQSKANTTCHRYLARDTARDTTRQKECKARLTRPATITPPLEHDPSWHNVVPASQAVKTMTVLEVVTNAPLLPLVTEYTTWYEPGLALLMPQ